MSLIHLVYVSTETRKLSEADLRDILEISRRNNAQQNVTGMLLFRQGIFLQVLEGDANTVKALYEHIEQDDRHKNVTIISLEAIKVRTFSQWAMGFNLFDGTNGADIPGFTNFLKHPRVDYFIESPSYAKMLLKSFQAQSSM